MCVCVIYWRMCLGIAVNRYDRVTVFKGKDENMEGWFRCGAPLGRSGPGEDRHPRWRPG